jgi:serine/threonine-protein kinase
MQIRLGDEEARASLQGRLVVLSALMFWSFVALLLFMVILYSAYPGIEPARNKLIYAIAAFGLVLLGVIWQGFLVRRTLTIGQLRAIDVFYSFGTGASFAAGGYLASDLRPSAYICLLYACFMVLLRAIVVPSSARRTMVIGIVTCLPMTLATVALGFQTEQDIPGPAYVTGDVIISTIVILLATIGSGVIYGLRRKITAAMQLGQYTLDGKLGEGGMGAVYRARHALLRRPTAIKLMLPDRIDAETLDRFEREVQHMSQLTHANTVAVYDYGRSPDGVFYYAMEYLDGIDLENLVLAFGPQPAERVIAILIQVCGALEEAHRRGLIHRDIKPANIILCERGDVPDVAKVVDFGLVKEFASRVGKSSRGILGTPAYIAPESVTDPARVGPAADLYTLGAVAYFLLTGKRVFDGKTSVDVCVQHVTAKPIPPSQLAAVPSQLEQIILGCLAKQPADRPASAAALAKQLRAVPASGDWSDEEALRWWVDFRRLPPRNLVGSTQTITIDIDHHHTVSERLESLARAD